MKCVFCGHLESKVIDSRTANDSFKIRRRRECLECGKRFTTYESIESSPILVVKKDGTRQTFDSQKIKRGLIKACEKRPVSINEIDSIVANIEKQIYNSMEGEVTSTHIGELIMQELKERDDVAYIRFASVYRQFKDVTTFMRFISEFGKVIKDEN